MTTHLSELLAQGQSPWLDYIRRSLLTSGDLRRMVDEQGITGVTINPTIFEKAIAGSQDYDEPLKLLLAHEPHLTPAELYERLAVQDVTMAADVLRPVFDRTGGADGFVSLEVAPGLAHDTNGTVAEARRLWGEVHRPNLLIKVPATTEGVAAVEQLLSEGINVNVTLMFSIAHYEAIAQAFLRGSARATAPEPLASVASVFVSRIDSAIDKVLSGSKDPGAAALRGKVAIANARAIYARYQALFTGPSYGPWAAKGVRPQRVLWASTSTKDPTYRDTLYVEELVGRDTVDTIPPATLSAFLDHGVVRGPTLTEAVPEALALLDRLPAMGIDLLRVCDDLQVEGVAAFSDSYAKLLASLEGKKATLLAEDLDPLDWTLGAHSDAVESRVADWQASRVPTRMWQSDPTLWPAAPSKDVADRMGWLRLPETMHGQLGELLALAKEIRAEGFRHVVVLGMGGSSLAPDVFRASFPPKPGEIELLILDSTHPDAVAAVAARIDLRKTLFVVSSKSGTTTEPLSFYLYFWEAVAAAGGAPGRQFIAVTDPGTPLEKLAVQQGFRTVFRAVSTVGGRYSALTMFGLVPAALLGVDVAALLDQAWTMSEACAPSLPAAQNPGLALGAVLGELTVGGRDKLTFYASEWFAAFPMWAEQLIAESTGKVGKGIVPIVHEPLAAPEAYGRDRLFVEIQEIGHEDAGLSDHLARLAAAGQPIVRLRVRSALDLGQEFFRWEFAVAASGMILGIDPYDQPDVEYAKELARQAMSQPSGTPGGVPVPTVRADDAAGLAKAIAEWTGSAHPGDYIGIQAYLAPTEPTSAMLEGIRGQLLERFHLATTLGYGPRFLHSTGQLHKGGPNSGMFLQIVDAPARDLPVPSAGYTFGQLIRAQALGDYQALRHKDRRVLRVDLGPDVSAGLRRLAEALHG